MPATLTARGLTVVRGDAFVLRDIDLTMSPGRRVGVVGPNGVGKTTLLATCAGEIAPTAGTVGLDPPSAAIGWLHQEPDRVGGTVRTLLHERTGVAAAQRTLDEAVAGVAAGAPRAAERYDDALHRWLALGAADLDARIGRVAADLGLGTDVLDQATGSLSGGEAARVGLAALILSRYDLYLLDEPTNDLDLDGLERLESWVLGLDAGVMLVSHDRRFLERVVTDVVEIDEFARTATTYGGGWGSYVAERERARAHARARFEEYDTARRSLAERAQREREWAQRGRARVRRSMADEPDRNIRRYRLDQTERLAARSAQTKRAIDRLDEVDEPREPWELRLTIPDVPRSGDIVARLRGAVVERGGFRLGPVDLLVEFGERIAIVGANGAGKSTLIDLILGRCVPVAGSASLGAAVSVGEIEQVRGQLATGETLLRTFTEATQLDVAASRTLLAKFGLVADHVTRPTASLSPGERTRATLALLQANGANLLVLDEPTNHLDLPAIEQLEQALEAYAGTLVLVTHDRAFLERVACTRTVSVDAGLVTSR